VPGEVGVHRDAEPGGEDQIAVLPGFCGSLAVDGLALAAVQHRAQPGAL